MTSRSETMPLIRAPSTTGRAPIRFSPSLRTASNRVAFAGIDSIALPLPRSTAAMVMVVLPRLVTLIVPLRAAKGKSMPEPDPVPSPRHSTMRRFWRIFRLLAVLSIVVAAIAVVLVMRGEEQVHVQMIVATALGIGLTVLLGTALMTLVFLSAD